MSDREPVYVTITRANGGHEEGVLVATVIAGELELELPITLGEGDSLKLETTLTVRD